MANIRYTGNELNRKQVDQRTVGAPVSGSSVYTITINGKAYTYTAQSNTDTVVAAALVADFNSQSDFLETQDCPATVSGAVISFTSNTAGVPFTNSYGVAGGGTFNGSTTTSNMGSGVFSDASNWSATINAADNLILDLPGINVQFLLSSLTTVLGTFTVMATFDGELGLPVTNQAGYPEYRPLYAVVKSQTINIGQGDGSGPSRCYIQTDAGAAATITIWKTGSSNDNYPACMIKHTAGGGNSFTLVTVIDGDVGIAMLPDEAATVTTLNVGGDGGNPTVKCGISVTLTTLNAASGDIQLSSSPSGTTTITGGATVTIARGGAAVLFNIDDGTLFLGGNGTAMTITDITVGENGVLDLSQGVGAITVTNGIKLYRGWRINDPINRLATGTVLKPQNGIWEDGTYIGAPGTTFTKS